MKFRFSMATVWVLLLGVSAFADTIRFTNSGVLSGNLNSGVVSSSDNLSVNGIPITGSAFGTLVFSLGSFNGSLTNSGSFTNGNFELDATGAVLFVTQFSGTWDRVGQGVYELLGTFSGVATGIQFSGFTDQRFGLNFNGEGEISFEDLRGATTITTGTVPEPGTLVLLGTGLAGLAGMVRRKIGGGGTRVLDWSRRAGTKRIRRI